MISFEPLARGLHGEDVDTLHQGLRVVFWMGLAVGLLAGILVVAAGVGLARLHAPVPAQEQPAERVA